MNWKLVAGGLLLLLTGAYLDNTRGPLLPIFRSAFDLNYTQTSFYLVAAYATAIAFNLLLLPLSNRFSEKKLTLGVCALGTLTAIGGHWVSNYPLLIAHGILLGATITSVGTMCNILVIKGSPPRRRGQFLSALHLMYGLGAFFCPPAVAYVIQTGLPWPWVLSMVAPVLFLLIAALLVGERTQTHSSQAVPEKSRLGLLQIIIIVSFASYVGGEVIITMWLTTFLVDTAGVPLGTATSYLSGFFIVMVISRCFCLLPIPTKLEKHLLWGALVLGALFFVLGRAGHFWGFSMAGIVGPFFPLLLARISRNYPQQWKSMTIWVITSMQGTLAFCHFAVGRLADSFGLTATYWLPIAFFALSLSLLMSYFRWESTHKA